MRLRRQAIYLFVLLVAGPVVVSVIALEGVDPAIRMVAGGLCAGAGLVAAIVVFVLFRQKWDRRDDED